MNGCCWTLREACNNWTSPKLLLIHLMWAVWVSSVLLCGKNPSSLVSEAAQINLACWMVPLDIAHLAHTAHSLSHSCLVCWDNWFRQKSINLYRLRLSRTWHWYFDSMRQQPLLLDIMTPVPLLRVRSWIVIVIFSNASGSLQTFTLLVINWSARIWINSYKTDSCYKLTPSN